MKRTLIVLSILLTGLVVGSGRASAQAADFGLSIANGQVQDFHVAVGDYYGVQPSDIGYIQQQGICEDEIPVVLFMSQRSGYAPDLILRMRQRGASWYDISNRCNIDPAVYYTTAGYTNYGAQGYGPPYGNAWGYGKKARRMVISDANIVSAINVNFLSGRYHHDGAEVLRLRSGGKSFQSICSEYQHPQYQGYRGYDRDQNRGNNRYRENNRGNYGHRGNNGHRGWSNN